MKKRTMILSAALIASLLIGTAVASDGGADDPLLSLSYLKEIFSGTIEKKIDAALDTSDAAVQAAAVPLWQDAVEDAKASTQIQTAGRFTELDLNGGDVLRGFTGTQVVLYEGSAVIEYSGAAVIDVTTGKEAENGAELLPLHRYLAAEDTDVRVTILSATAIVNCCGAYYVVPSALPDYYGMAAALKTLDLFRGDESPLAHGFALGREPSRIEALVMLIRLLGEEQAALACKASTPFADVPANEWYAPYVSYAYEKGYSNGVSATEFGAEETATVEMYVEFVMRALGYSSTAHSNIADSPDRACSAGVLTADERAMLQADSFRRSAVVYLSYYALGTKLNGSSALLSDRLIQAGVFSREAYRDAQKTVVSERVG